VTAPTADTARTSTDGAALVCRGLAVAAGGATVLRDLDLVVPAGRRTVVVGPSGAGKTTLLRAVAGLEQLAAGTVELDGRDLAGVPSHRRRLAVVFQEPRLFPNLSVGDNVTFPLRMAGVGRAQRRRVASRLLDEVGLGGLAPRDPRGLSGGEQQRVALARALAGDPRLLLLDEPLSAVDPNRREDLRQLIARLQRDRSITTVSVTHDRSEAAELGDRVALLIEGRIVQHAPPEELFTRPASAVVARFFGSTNLLRGTVVDGRLHTPAGHLRVAAPDGPTTVTIRPERLRLATDGPLHGTCTEATFQGTHRRVVAVAGDLRLEAHVDPDGDAVPGHIVGLDVDPAHVWVLPDAGEAAGTTRRSRR
jgi:thiamine transport system ATP-binding protein